MLHFFKQITHLLILTLVLISCQTSYRTARQDYTAANFENIKKLQIGMSLDQVRQVMNAKYHWEARYTNPEYYEQLVGRDSIKYLVHFYRYQSGASGNLVYNDERFFPAIFKTEVIVGLGWKDFQTFLGEEIKFSKGDSKTSSVIADNRKPPSNRPKDVDQMSFGSGFLISSDGLLVTNYHVVDKAITIKAYFNNIDKEFFCKVKIKDESNDLVILEIVDTTFYETDIPPIVYKRAKTQNIKTGQEVFTLGFPLTSVMGSTPRLATGTINSLYGIDEDPRVFQISNPVQPGNSGGPLFNYSGELVGIVVSGLNAAYFLYYSGIVPQNMNFAVKVNYLSTLLDLIGIDIEDTGTTIKGEKLPFEDLVKDLEIYIALIKVSY